MSIRYAWADDEFGMTSSTPLAPDEDFPPPLPPPVAPNACIAALLLVVSLGGGQDEAGFLYGAYEEDAFFPRPQVVQLQPQPAILEQLDFYSSFVNGTQDEDFWSVPQPQRQPAAFQPALLEETFYSSFTNGVGDEDFWAVSVPPLPTPRVTAFTDDDVWPTPAATPFQPDEDFWQPPQPQYVALPAPIVFFEVVGAQPPANPCQDEDFWALPAPQALQTAPQQPVQGTDEWVPFVAPIRDEDFPPPLPFPVQLAGRPPGAFTDDDVLFPPPVPLYVDEVFWAVTVIPPKYPFIGALLDPDQWVKNTNLPQVPYVEWPFGGIDGQGQLGTTYQAPYGGNGIIGSNWGQGGALTGGNTSAGANSGGGNPILGPSNFPGGYDGSGENT